MRLIFTLLVLMLTTAGRADDMPAMRRAAADRARPLMFNNDGDEIVYEMKTPTVEDFLRCRTTGLADSQVSTIVYCTWSSPFGVFTHHSKIADLYATTEGMFKTNLTQAMKAKGLDPLRLISEWSRKHGREVFWSMRMNDTHDGQGGEYGPLMFKTSSIKREHPEWMLGSAKKPPRYGLWTAMDYGVPEVRDLAVAYCKEVCDQYDIDGLELDFFRHAIWFKTPASGQPATQAELDAMTQVVRRIRQAADEAGRKKGRAILLAVHVPDSVEYCRTIGLDVEGWMKDGLIDLLVPTGYVQLNPLEYSVALGKRYGVKVNPSLDECRIKDTPARKARMSIECYLARAAAAWAAGVDGVYTFNLFKPEHPAFRELGDPRKLEAMNKDYFASDRGSGRVPFPHAKFQNAPTLNPNDPLKLAAGKPTSCDIALGRESSERPPTVTLRLRLPEITSAGEVRVEFNGQAVDMSKAKINTVAPRSAEMRSAGAETWLELPLKPADLRPGRSTVTVTPVEGSAVKTWSDLSVRVRYR
jgi:hypothetical protein